MANNSKYGKFIGKTLKAFKNKYHKQGSFEYKISDAKKFFLDDFSKWLRSTEVNEALKQGRPLKFGAKRTFNDDNPSDPKEYLELTFYVGHTSSPPMQDRGAPPPVNNYQPDPDLDDDVPF